MITLACCMQGIVVCECSADDAAEFEREAKRAGKTLKVQFGACLILVKST